MKTSRKDIDFRITEIFARGAGGQPVTVHEAALIIGKYKTNPPLWAMDVCAAYYQDQQSGTPADKNMNILLDAVWDVVIEQQLDKLRSIQCVDVPIGTPSKGVSKPNIERAIKEGLSRTRLSMEIPTARAAWKTEEKSTRFPEVVRAVDGTDDDLTSLGLPSTYRGIRALRRRFKSDVPWRDSSAHKIASQ